MDSFVPSVTFGKFIKLRLSRHSRPFAVLTGFLHSYNPKHCQTFQKMQNERAFHPVHWRGQDKPCKHVGIILEKSDKVSREMVLVVREPPGTSVHPSDATLRRPEHQQQRGTSY